METLRLMHANRTDHSHIGGIDFLKRNSFIYVPYLIFYILGVIFGISGKQDLLIESLQYFIIW